MKKVVIIVLIVIACLGVVGGIAYASFSVINETKKDKEAEEKKEKEIIDAFDTFKEAISNFNIEWSTYNSVIKSDINKNTVYQYDGWILSLDTYTKAVDKLEETSKLFKDNCVGQYYANSDVRHKCEAWADAYEKAINSYVKDINDFNMVIEQINKDNKSSLEKYEEKYKLVDVNKDNTFSEVEVVEKEESK